MIRYILPLALLASPALAQAPRVGGLDVRNNLGEIAAAGAAAQAAARANLGANNAANLTAGTVPLARIPTGTAGAAIPLLNGANTWGANQSVLSLDNTLYCSQFASLQACHDALPSTGGKMVLPPSTTYTLLATLAISKPNVTLECPAWNTIIKRGFTTGQMVNATGDGDIIRGCAFDGNSANFTGANGEVQISGQTSLIDHVKISNIGASIGAALSGVNSRITGSSITGVSSTTIGSYGIWAISHVTVTIDNNTVTGTRIDGIGFDGQDSIVTGNHVSGNECFATTSPNAGGQIVSYQNANFGRVISNNIIGPPCAGALFAGGIEAGGEYVTITGNTLTGANIGIDPSGVGAIITGNTLRNVGQAGGTSQCFSIQTSVTNVTITGNKCVDDTGTGNTAVGVLLVSTNSHIIIKGNDFTGVTTPISVLSAITGPSFVIGDNDGIDNIAPPTFSCGNVLVTGQQPLVNISGTGTTNFLNSANGVRWVGRTFTMIPAAACVFSTAQNIGNAFTATPGVPIVASYDGAKWWLK